MQSIDEYVYLNITGTSGSSVTEDGVPRARAHRRLEYSSQTSVDPKRIHPQEDRTVCNTQLPLGGSTKQSTCDTNSETYSKRIVSQHTSPYFDNSQLKSKVSHSEVHQHSLANVTRKLFAASSLHAKLATDPTCSKTDSECEMFSPSHLEQNVHDNGDSDEDIFNDEKDTRSKGKIEPDDFLSKNESDNERDVSDMLADALAGDECENIGGSIMAGPTTFTIKNTENSEVVENDFEDLMNGCDIYKDKSDTENVEDVHKAAAAAATVSCDDNETLEAELECFVIEDDENISDGADMDDGILVQVVAEMEQDDADVNHGKSGKADTDNFTKIAEKIQSKTPSKSKSPPMGPRKGTPRKTRSKLKPECNQSSILSFFGGGVCSNKNKAQSSTSTAPSSGDNKTLSTSTLPSSAASPAILDKPETAGSRGIQVGNSSSKGATFTEPWSLNRQGTSNAASKVKSSTSNGSTNWAGSWGGEAGDNSGAKTGWKKRPCPFYKKMPGRQLWIIHVLVSLFVVKF